MQDDRLHGIAEPIKTMNRRRPLIGLLVAVLVAALGGLAVQATMPANAAPDIETVKKKVDRLYHEAEIASERYNTVNEQLKKSRAAIASLSADSTRQQNAVETMRGQVASLVVQQYQGQALSTASQVVLSDDPQTFLDNLTAISAYDSQRGQVMNDYTLQLARLELRKAAVKAESKQLAVLEKKLAKDKATIDDKAAEAKSELDKLEAAQRAKLMSGSFSGPLPNVPASGRAKAAVDYAMAQVGKAYVWGAAGPSAFDCSGLTMAAWGRAGVGLPHSSSAQYSSGPHVAESDLQPGDLVFYYSPISHVGMYIGGGMIVNAENPSVGVKVTSLHAMPYVGAVRPG